MARPTPGGLSPARLRLVLGGFFLALALPATVLVVHAYDQLKWEAFHQIRELARSMAERVDERLQRLVAREDARDFTQYQFLVVRGSDASSFVQPSELSRYPVRSDIPGLLGYFQVDAGGRFTTPLLPADPDQAQRYGIDEDELRLRAAREEAVLAVLSRNALAGARPPERQAGARAAGRSQAAPARGVHEREAALTDAIARMRKSGDKERSAERRNSPNEALSSSDPAAPRADAATRVEDLRLESPYPSVPAVASSKRGAEKPAARLTRRKLEQSADAALPVEGDAPAGAGQPRLERRITTFESELDPFDLSRLDSAHLILHRTAWRDGQRYTQGALIDRDGFMDGIVGESVLDTTLARLGEVTVAWNGTVSAVFSAAPDDAGGSVVRSVPGPPQGTLLYRTRLSDPAAQMELLFSITRLPPGPGARVLASASAVMALVLGGGVLLMYRLGLREIDLARQQQDFVAAVSHELRTPLTSIRMYGEMLREGWAIEEKKRGYYDFICNESERLSRLISNVLQLARMTRNDFDLELTTLSVGELMDGVRSKVGAQVHGNGFELAVDVPDALRSRRVRVNADAFSQIVINLVDNAIKFSSRATLRRVEIAARPGGDATRVAFSVRDHGPGVDRDQMKIFRLFYRAGNELTRETVGTGIGLALVNRLARAMQAEVDVASADPGAEFTLSVPAARDGG